MDGSSKMREATTPAKAREMTQGEKRESLISRLQVAIYVVNFIAVCFVSSVMAYSLWSVVGRMEAAECEDQTVETGSDDQLFNFGLSCFCHVWKSEPEVRRRVGGTSTAFS